MADIAVVTDEDHALDALLDARAAQAQMDVGAAQAMSGDDGLEVKKVTDRPELLSEFVENYEPAHSHASLEEQIFLARAHGADSIEAKDIVFKALVGKVPKEAYIMYKGVKVYRIGTIDEGQASDLMTIEQKVFGKSK